MSELSGGGLEVLMWDVCFQETYRSEAGEDGALIISDFWDICATSPSIGGRATRNVWAWELPDAVGMQETHD